MAVELEKKFRLTTELYDQIEIRLREIGAQFDREDFEENTIFELGELTGRPGVLRVRAVGERTLLTLKRPLASGSDIKQQIEFETEVGDRISVEGIIAELGLTADVIYEKRRRTWQYEQAEIVLDTLPFGLFMEIEGTVAAILAAEKSLEIEGWPIEPRTYPNITAEFGELIGKTVEARFDQNDPS